MGFLVNARLRAARILLIVYTHHVTSESRDVHIYARVVLSTYTWFGYIQTDSALLGLGYWVDGSEKCIPNGKLEQALSPRNETHSSQANMVNSLGNAHSS